MSGWNSVDDALMYGAGNEPDPWCADTACVHASARHKHTRLFRKPRVVAEDGTVLGVDRTLSPADPHPRDTPAWCPCGHWTGGDYQCLNGRIYGPCSDTNCTGVCDDTHGRCSADGCLCKEDE